MMVAVLVVREGLHIKDSILALLLLPLYHHLQPPKKKQKEKKVHFGRYNNN
jgi:hypothetical protein